MESNEILQNLIDDIKRGAKMKAVTLTNDHIANALSISRGHLQKYLNGNAPIPNDTIDILNNIYSVYLTITNTYLKSRLDKKNGDNKVIPFYDNVIAQGADYNKTHTLIPQNKTAHGFAPKSMFKEADFVIRMAGNSMLPNYPPNAVIGIRNISKSLIQPGSVYAIEIENDIIVKRVYFKNEDQYSGVIVCISENTMLDDHPSRKGLLKYPPSELNLDKDVLRIFKVTDFYKPNEITIYS